MSRSSGNLLAICLLVFFSTLQSAHGQIDEAAAWAATTQNDYRVSPNITYLKANNVDLKLDVYRPAAAEGPLPTFIYMHGGGWVGGNKEGNILRLLPFIESGWAVVNVQYRLGNVSLAPAAVEDCLCALRWVIRNAEEYGFDSSRIVVSGNSAGGHLALTTGMLPASAGLDRQCPGNEPLQVAAIVNWYGITDVADLLEGDNMKTYAVQWMGSLPDRHEIAERVSPLNYVRRGLPPIITIHGDADPTVPYMHATRLQSALNEAGVPNQLVTIPDGLHGRFAADEMLRAYGEIFKFLSKHVQ